MVFTRAVNVDWQIDLAQIDLFAAHRRLARLDQVVFKIGIAKVPGVKRARQIGRIAVPVEQVKRRWGFAFQIIPDDVVPHQIVGPQEREGGCQIATLHQAPLPHFLLAVLNEGLVDEQIENAGVFEIQQRGKERGAGHRFLFARGQHRQSRRQDRAPDAEAQRVDQFGSGDVLHHGNRLDGRVFNVVVPRFCAHRCVRVTPTHDKRSVALCHSVADQRVLGLQIQNVKLVDARRNQQERLLVDLASQRFVLNQLKQLVLKNNCTFGGRHVFTDFKLALIRHRHMALAHVVHQVFEALGNALALGFNCLLLRIDVESQKITGRRGGQPLLDGKADA